MDDRPKALRYAGTVADAERRIIEALPDILDALVKKAREGDTRAAFYLIDRMLGRPAGIKGSPPVEDRRAPRVDIDGWV